MTAREARLALRALLAAALGGCPSPADVPPRACVTSEDCVLVPASCCGRCRRPTRDDAIALSAAGADAFREAVCGDRTGCELCDSVGAAPYALACEEGLCTLRDPEERASLTECTIDADCRLRRARCCDCGSHDDVLSPVNELIAVRADAEEEVRAWLCAPGERCGCESPEPYGGSCYAGRCGSRVSRREVALLFVIDGSVQMAEEQAALADALPTLVRALVSGDLDDDGAPDFAPIAVLTIGVVTMDMGTGGQPTPTCLRADFGDDGVSRVSVWSTDRCGVPSPGVFQFEEPNEPDDVARRLACAVTVGTGGCGIEQPLEAALKALTPARPDFAWGVSPDFVAVGSSGAPDGLDVPFFMSTTPHGDDENEYLDPWMSALAVVLLSDEDDCSILDPALFDPAGAAYPGELALRCTRYREALHPITRYARGLAQLRDRPNRIVFAPIVGVPLDLVAPAGEATRWDALVSDDLAIRDDRMEVRETPTEPPAAVPSCEDPERGRAYPPERIAHTARALEARGAHVTVQSICQPRLDGAMTAIARAIGLALR